MYSSMMSPFHKHYNEPFGQVKELPRKIIYIPFIDNNGNTWETFEDF